MCFAEFAATYTVKYGTDDVSDVLPVEETDITSSQIVLTDGFGRMNKHE